MLVDNVFTVLHLEGTLLRRTGCNNNTGDLKDPKDIELLEQTSDQFQCSDCYLKIEDLQSLALVYDNLEKGVQSANDVIKTHSLQNFVLRCEAEREKMANNRTTCLWIQYMDMVSLLQRFIQAERTGDWSLHQENLQ